MGKPVQKSEEEVNNPITSELDEPEKSETEHHEEEEVEDDENEESEEYSEDESESDEKSVHLMVEDMPMRSRFLTKIGILFTLYFFFLLSACLFVVYQVEYSRHFYRRLYLENIIWFILCLIVILKVTCGFIGGKFKAFLGLLYIADTLLSMFFVVSLYFWVDSKLANKFTNNAPRVFIFIASFFSSSLVFTLTTLLRSQRNTFSFFLSILFLAVTNGCLIFFFFEFWRTYITITLPQYMGMFAIVTIINIYLSLNSYMVVRFRTKMYYDNDSLQCYYRYWVDWFSYFWIDGFRSSRTLRKIIRQRRQKEKLRRQAELREQKDSKTKAIEKWTQARRKSKNQMTRGKSKTQGPVVVG